MLLALYTITIAAYLHIMPQSPTAAGVLLLLVLGLPPAAWITYQMGSWWGDLCYMAASALGIIGMPLLFLRVGEMLYGVIPAFDAVIPPLMLAIVPAAYLLPPLTQAGRRYAPRLLRRRDR